MLRSLLVVLLLSVAAFAQPIEGPWTVVEVETQFNVTNPHVVLRDGRTADVFYQLGDAVYHLTASLTSGQIVAGPEVILAAGNWTREVSDVIATDSGWAAVIIGRTGSFNRIDILVEHNGSLANVYSRESYNCAVGAPPGFSCHEYLFASIAKLSVDSILVCALGNWSVNFGYFESGTSLETFRFGSEGGSETPTTCETAWWMGTPLFPHIVTDDSIVVFAANEFSPQIVSTNGYYYNCLDLVYYSCRLNPIEAVWSHGGRMLVLSKSGSFYGGSFPSQLVEMSGSSCIERIPLAIDPLAAASSPNYGLAWLSHVGGGLLMTRADTNGTEHLSTGDVFRTDETHVLVEASMAMTDSGRVAVVWTERNLNESNARQLKIAALGWDTPLDVPGSHSILHPSSFILSAFPNPFNSELRISYELPRAGSVELAVFNLLGRKVASLFDGQQAAGSHELSWSPTGAGGIYFVSLKTAGEERIQKVVYLR